MEGCEIFCWEGNLIQDSQRFSSPLLPVIYLNLPAYLKSEEWAFWCLQHEFACIFALLRSALSSPPGSCAVPAIWLEPIRMLFNGSSQMAATPTEQEMSHSLRTPVFHQSVLTPECWASRDYHPSGIDWKATFRGWMLVSGSTPREEIFSSYWSWQGFLG